MCDLIEKENIKIEDMIYEIREVQVMLDSDLAKLYHCVNGTKSINLAVKRNINKFPSDFYFQLTTEEYNNLKFQNETSSSTYGGVRKIPYVFTEQGVAMLASIIHTEIAETISIKIMRAFVSMRHFIIENKDIYKSINNLNNKLLEHDEKINYLFSRFDKKEQLFLKNETFSAYCNLLDIINSAENEIIVVDMYADITFLDLIKNIKCRVILITRNSDRLNDTIIDKYNKQYNNLKVIRDNSFHDRLIIIDKKDIYLSGTSINNMGDKTFMIIKLEDKSTKENILNNINKIINK